MLMASEEILVVDDKPENLKFLSSLLQGRGYIIRKATSGAMALRSVQMHPPDLILLDICLPDMDGYEVCRSLKQLETVKAVPVIFLSVVDSAFNKVKAFELGAVDYITKPFAIEEVLVRVTNHLTLWRQYKELLDKHSRLQEEVERRQQVERELQRANEQLSQLALVDNLTQLANRRAFDAYLHHEWQRLSRQAYQQSAYLSLILVDVDFFKRYNDTYGHVVGDQCLQQVAFALQHCAERSTDLVARYGGEEFVMVLPDVNRKGAIAIAQRVQTAIADLNISHANSAISHLVTVSLGVATVIPTLATTPGSLIQLADLALYAAKSNGRNQYRVN